MKIQSLSVVVPAKQCINNCKFCVARMKEEPYKNQFDANLPFYHLYQDDYLKRLAFARDNGCNTVMLTGNAEPQQNRAFLKDFGTLNRQLERPFRWIEMQTTGRLLDDPYLRFLRNHVGVSTISLSICSFDDIKNGETCQMKEPVDLHHLCHEIKRYDFNLRISVNLTDEFNHMGAEEIIDYCKNELKADQITFRVLYQSDENTDQDKWIDEHTVKPELIEEIKEYIRRFGRPLERLVFGAMKYSIKGMSVVLDDDCMATATDKEELKYLILRPNCKLYSKWDDPASLIF